jgi:hypothetical protein
VYVLGCSTESTSVKSFCCSSLPVDWGFVELGAYEAGDDVCGIGMDISVIADIYGRKETLELMWG